MNKATMSKSDTSEDISELGDDDKNNIQEILAGEPMYYVLSQFFDTEDDPPKNIAMMLKELIVELRGIKEALQTANAARATMNPAPASE